MGGPTTSVSKKVQRCRIKREDINNNSSKNNEQNLKRPLFHDDATDVDFRKKFQMMDEENKENEMSFCNLEKKKDYCKNSECEKLKCEKCDKIFKRYFRCRSFIDI